MPSRIHVAPETIVAGVQVIPAVIPEQPSILHPAVLVKVIPVSASIVCQVFPLSMRIRAVVIAEPPAVQTPGSLRIPVSASGSNGFLCVTLCMVKANGDPMGIKTVNTSSNLQIFIGRQPSIIFCKFTALQDPASRLSGIADCPLPAAARILLIVIIPAHRLCVKGQHKGHASRLHRSPDGISVPPPASVSSVGSDCGYRIDDAAHLIRFQYLGAPVLSKRAIHHTEDHLGSFLFRMLGSLRSGRVSGIGRICGFGGIRRLSRVRGVRRLLVLCVINAYDQILCDRSRHTAVDPAQGISRDLHPRILGHIVLCTRSKASYRISGDRSSSGFIQVPDGHGILRNPPYYGKQSKLRRRKLDPLIGSLQIRDRFHPSGGNGCP